MIEVIVIVIILTILFTILFTIGGIWLDKRKAKQLQEHFADEDKLMEELCKALVEYKPYEKIVKERELKHALIGFLQARFPNQKLQREVRLSSGEYIDLQVEDIGIELKIAYDHTTLRNLIGQAGFYLNKVRRLIVFVYVFRDLDKSEEYINSLKAMGCKIIICDYNKGSELK